MKNIASSIVLGVCFLLGSLVVNAGERPMGFFVTSVGMGNGADLGGLKGADAHCQKLASAAGAGEREWRAYLSTKNGDKRGVFARARIGDGPWYNAHLETALDESGNRIKGRGDKPNEHDILTGSQDDGTPYFPRDGKDHTCSNWTSSGEGSAQVGHHDRHGGGNPSWSSAHASRGCSQEDLTKTGGAGKFYCFAAD